jgi:hypothetical protein
MNQQSYVHIRLRRDTSTNWSLNNPVLKVGEPGYEKDTRKLKIGDGITSWNSLPYFNSGATIDSEDIQDIIGSGFLVAGTGINISYNDGSDSLTLSTSGLINNPANNRILTSRDNTTTGIDAESNLTFDGSLLAISGNLVANTGTINSLNFNNIGDPDLSIRQLAWNNSEGSLAVGLSDTYEMFLGGELHYRVRNNTGSSILAGTAVYATGLTPGGNNRIEIAPKAADGSIREVRFMGLVTENIDNAVNGFTTHFGYIRNIDTRGDYAANGATNKVWASGEPVWTEGDLLYVHPTVAGKLTKIEPKHSISVAIILNRHQNQGKLFVRPTSYGHLNDNHDVAVSGATNGQFLQYNSSTDYWVPSSSGDFSTLLVNGTGVSVSGHTHISTDITDSTSFGRNILTASSYPAQNKLGWTIVPNDTTSLTAEIGGQYYLPRTIFTGPVGNCTINDPSSGTFGDFYTVIKNAANYNTNVNVGGINYGQSSGVYIHRYWSFDVEFPPSGSWKTRTLNDYHKHTASEITDFNSSVSGIVNNSLSTDVIAGTGISINYDNINDDLIISTNGLTPILALGSISGSNAINYATDRPIQSISLGGTSTTLTKGTGWPTTSVSCDVLLRITVTSATSITWTIITVWFSQPPAGAWSIGSHLVLLRAIGSSIIEGHYIGSKTN